MQRGAGEIDRWCIVDKKEKKKNGGIKIICLGFVAFKWLNGASTHGYFNSPHDVIAIAIRSAYDNVSYRRWNGTAVSVRDPFDYSARAIEYNSL